MTYTNVACAMHPATSAGLLAPSLDLKPIAKTQEQMTRAAEIKTIRAKAQSQHPFALYEETKQLFDVGDAIKMNFVPQMVTAFALQQCLDVCSYCAAKRLSEAKHATRALKSLVERYANHLSNAFGNQVKAYNYFLNRYREAVQLTEMQTVFTIQNLVNRLHPHCFERELAARLWVTHAAFEYAEAIERRWDAEIDRRFGRHIHRRRDRALQKIVEILDIIEDALLAPMPKDNADLQLCMRVLENKAYDLADELIEEDNQ